MKTIQIHGKDYIPVNERVKAFRESENFKNWSIETNIERLENEIVIIKAIVKNESGRIISTGYACEDKKTSHINKTNFIENGETSAIGRALAFCGIGIDTSIASSDEVSNALEKQNKIDLVKNEFNSVDSLKILSIKSEISAFLESEGIKKSDMKEQIQKARDILGIGKGLEEMNLKDWQDIKEFMPDFLRK